MKKVLSLVLVCLMLAGCMSVSAFAEAAVTVNVTVADKGKLVAAQTKVSVTDIDSDGKLTVNDALYAVHKEAYPSGAEAGYSYYVHKDYGLSIGKLWGDSSGNFGYYLNNVSCWSLSDTVKDGDYLNAFVYADSKKFSDTYCFFDEYTLTSDTNTDITLTLNGAGYDENWNSITVPVKNAEITVDGKGTGIRTDENGKATIQIKGNGEYVISAKSESLVLVPPVCTAQINGGFFVWLRVVFTSFFDDVAEFFMSVYNYLVSLFK